MSNQVAQRPKFSQVIQSDGIQNLIFQTLGDKKQARGFVASISSAVASNPTLQGCTPFSIINGALVGETLNLAHSPQMGQYFLVPYNNTKTREKEAQFQIGWKGYWQLAMKTGQYRKIVITEVKEGELKSYNPFTETFVFEALDAQERAKAKTMGFYGMFILLNGFTKEIYMSMEEMENHAETYSSGYRAKKGYTFWEKSFDEMGKKTIIRQLISKFGIMSTEMQVAYEKDMAVIREDGLFEYVDNLPEETGKTRYENEIQHEPDEENDFEGMGIDDL